MLIGMVISPSLDSCAFGQQIHPVGTAPQSDFTQGGQVFQGKEIGGRLFCLFTPAGISDFQAFQQFLRLYIYQLHLVSLVKDRIRDALPHKNTGNGRNHII